MLIHESISLLIKRENDQTITTKLVWLSLWESNSVPSSKVGGVFSFLELSWNRCHSSSTNQSEPINIIYFPPILHNLTEENLFSLPNYYSCFYEGEIFSFSWCELSFKILMFRFNLLNYLTKRSLNKGMKLLTRLQLFSTTWRERVT